MNSLIRHKGWTWGFRSTVVLYFVILIVLPILGVYYNSFSAGLGSFTESVSDPIAWKSVLLTLKLAVIAALTNVLLGTMIAWVLIRYKFRGRALLNSLVDLPFALPTAVGGLMILLLLGPGSLIGGLAESLGFTIVFHQPAIVIAMVFVTFPFVIRAVQPLLEELDASEEEAAYTMGAKPSRVFLQVILPSMAPGMIGGGMLAFSRALAEFGAVVLVAGNIPGRTLVSSVYIFGEVESDNPAGAAAVSIILLTLSFLILWLISLMQMRGEDHEKIVDWTDLPRVLRPDCSSAWQDDNGGLQRRLERLLERPDPARGAACAADDRICCSGCDAAEYAVWDHDGPVSGTGELAGPAPQSLLNSIVDLPYAVSPVIGGLMIVLLLGPDSALGALFEQIGVKIVYAFPGMVIATLFVTFPLMVREVMPVLQEIGSQQEEAASTLGAYGWTTFWKVTWPSIRWAVIYGVILTVARSLGEFGAVLVVSGNIMNRTQTATTLVYQDVENFNVTAAGGIALVLAAFSAGLLLLMEWSKRRKGGH